MKNHWIWDVLIAVVGVACFAGLAYALIHLGGAS